MNRERKPAQVFVELSDTCAAEFGPLHPFDRLVPATAHALVTRTMEPAAVIEAPTRS
ncbi:hypothetical protein ACIBAH_19840 [Streptomyces sp. NPDC051445]|uniref:hypothetical protein n=1 Tax=unclassified Streptomyces TaxID=2593676 RepID=UPI0037AC1436